MRKFLARRRRIGGIMAAAAAVAAAWCPLAAAQELDWRVRGGEGALEPTARVRIVVENRLPPPAVAADLGLVQTVVYLYEAQAAAAPALQRAAGSTGLWADERTPSGEATRVTVRIPGVQDTEVGLALVIGRSLKVQGAVDADSLARGAVRADAGDLAERRRWALDTLVPAGQERTIWEGAVPLETDRIYVDYLAVRSQRSPTLQAGPGAAPAPDAAPDSAAGGILRLPPTVPPQGAPPVPLTQGSTLARAAGERIRPLALERGVLNIVRVAALSDVTGAFTSEVSVTTAPLAAAAGP